METLKIRQGRVSSYLKASGMDLLSARGRARLRRGSRWSHAHRRHQRTRGHSSPRWGGGGHSSRTPGLHYPESSGRAGTTPPSMLGAIKRAARQALPLASE